MCKEEVKYIGVSGSREFTRENLLFEQLDKLHKQYEFITIVSGGAKGADTMAKNYANSHTINLIEYLPDYSKGRYAPFLRNTTIAQKCDILVACLVNHLPCNGTRDTIRKTMDLNKQIIYIEEK